MCLSAIELERMRVCVRVCHRLSTHIYTPNPTHPLTSAMNRGQVAGIGCGPNTTLCVWVCGCVCVRVCVSMCERGHAHVSTLVYMYAHVHV